jgi:hypothetical protein
MPPDLFGYYLPSLDFVFPILDHIGLFLALHAHVLVSLPIISVSDLAETIRSLTTGSASHKTVTQDVSRILWYYYNDSVSPSLPFSQTILTTSERYSYSVSQTKHSSSAST